MKLKYFVGIAFVAAVGGFLIYHFLNRKDGANTNTVSGSGKKFHPKSK